MSSITEQELLKLINSNDSKNIKINGKNYWIGRKVKDTLKRKQAEGGIIPLLALIPGIIAGLSGAAGIAAGVAGTVAQSRAAQKVELEKDKLKKEFETLNINEGKGITSGAGVYLNPNEGKGIYLNPEGKDLNTVRLKVAGSGIYLNPDQGSAIHKYLKDTLQDNDLKEITKRLKQGGNIFYSGEGIFLGPV